MTEAEAAKASRADRPMLVYVYRDSDKDSEDPRGAIESDRAFATDKVAIGARFFDCLRMTAAEAKKDRILAKMARSAPCLVFVRPNFEIAATLRGTPSGGKIFGAMCKTMRLDYENCVATAVKSLKGIDKARAKLQRDRDVLARLDKKLTDTRGARKVSLEKKRETLNDKLAKADAALLKRENSVFDLKPRA